jgi:hypothetical protein
MRRSAARRRASRFGDRRSIEEKDGALLAAQQSRAKQGRSKGGIASHAATRIAQRVVRHRSGEQTREPGRVIGDLQVLGRIETTVLEQSAHIGALT